MLKHAKKKSDLVVAPAPRTPINRMVFEVGADGRLLYVGDNLARLLGTSAADTTHAKLLDWVHPAEAEAVAGALAAVFDPDRGSADLEFRVFSRAGSWTPLQASAVFTDRTTPPRAVINARDISLSVGVDPRTPAEIDRFTALTRYATEVVAIFDDQFKCRLASGSSRNIYGCEPHEVDWQRFTQSIVEKDRQNVLAALARVRATPSGVIEVEYRCRRNDGQTVYVQSRFVNGREDPNVGGLAIYSRDITARTLVDPVTSLPSRPFLMEHLRHVLEAAPSDGTSAALLVVKMDKLDVIESGLLPEERDQLLAEVGKRLLACAGRRTTVARLEAGQFAILCEDLADSDAPNELAKSIHSVLSKPISAGEHEIFLRVRVGIALADKDRGGPAGLLRAAQTALASASATDSKKVLLYRTSMANRMNMRMTVESDLRNALERGELDVYYQPVVDLRSELTAGFEALLRWNHPVKGPISPALFVPVAEECGQISAIGGWVIDQACAQLKKWRLDFGSASEMFVSINLSPDQLNEDGLLDELDQVLERTGLAPQRIRLELTESAIKDPARVSSTLAALKLRGFSLALDDFGTGYSSLSHLHQYPFDVVKIDRSFVSNIETNDRERSLVGGIVQLGQTLGMKIIAEGVETSGQAAILRDMGCDMVQGFHYGRAEPAGEATGYIVRLWRRLDE